MKNVMTIGLLMVLASPVAAEVDVMTANGCMACHKVDKKVVGPAFKEIAKVYAADKNVKERFSLALKNGSKGNWGKIPMPPQPRVKSTDVDAMVAWILAQK